MCSRFHHFSMKSPNNLEISALSDLRISIGVKPLQCTVFISPITSLLCPFELSQTVPETPPPPTIYAPGVSRWRGSGHWSPGIRVTRLWR